MPTAVFRLVLALAQPPVVDAAPPTSRDAEVPLETARFIPGKGFQLGTEDERFTLRIHGRIQFRWEIEHPNTPDDNDRQSLMIRRARVVLAGNAFSKHVKFYLQLGFSPRDQQSGVPNESGSLRRTPLRDARIEVDRLRDLTVWAGQMKVPFSRERVISSSSLSLVDRSLVNEELQLERDLGVQLLSKDIGGIGWLAYHAGVFLGEGRNAFEPSDFGMLYVARVELTPLGKFDDYAEGDVDRLPTPKLSIGGAYAYQDRAHYDRGTFGEPPADRGTSDVHNTTADAIFKWRGLSVQTAFHLRRTARRRQGEAVDDAGVPIPASLPRDGVGWFGQLGWLVPKIPLELVTRYSLVRNVRGDDRSSLPWRDEAGGGINYYFAGHWLKLQLDYFRLWGEEHGITHAAAARRGTDRVRLQLQLSF